MKKSALIAFIILSSVTAYAQAIPPYTGDNQQVMPESIPSVPSKNKDLPAQAGCFMLEGGVSGYYTSGKYYKDGTIDSKGKSYAPWGLKVNPTAEFFLFNMFSLGIITSFTYDQLGADNVLSIGIGPIISVYFNQTYPVIPFISIFGTYGHQNFYDGAAKSMYWTDQAIQGGIKTGAAYMVSKQAGVFVDLRFTYGLHYVQAVGSLTRSKENGWIGETFFGMKYFIF
jgi:hypothetical protein